MTLAEAFELPKDTTWIVYHRLSKHVLYAGPSKKFAKLVENVETFTLKPMTKHTITPAKQAEYLEINLY